VSPVRPPLLVLSFGSARFSSGDAGFNQPANAAITTFFSSFFSLALPGDIFSQFRSRAGKRPPPRRPWWLARRSVKRERKSVIAA